MAGNTAEKVEKLISATVAEMGYDLWDVRFLKEGASWYLRVFIDKDEGVWINDCTDVSHAIDPILDEADIIDKSYYLEVCSAGLERELLKPAHFEKMKGREVMVHLYRAVDGEKDYCGILADYDGGVKITVGDKEYYFEKGLYSSVKLNDMTI
ncbi:MAG: ribosome maturation factor RimP [Clostridia bacterium]|nr:ribosome maturation factor RimP [Clostridia bacterium]